MDCGRSLQYRAPHVHVALRGLDRTGAEFRLDRDYVRNGLRSVTQHFATVQLGYQTEQDAASALRRLIPVQRFSPLDRLILGRSQSTPDFPGYLQVVAAASRPCLGRFAGGREQSIAARLMTLETMGLARPMVRTAGESGQILRSS